MKFKMQRKILLPLVVIGMLFGIICTAGCITGTDSGSPNDVVGTWEFKGVQTVEFKENNIATIIKKGEGEVVIWDYLGSGMYYTCDNNEEIWTYYLKDDILYGGSNVVLSKKEGPEDSIVGTWQTSLGEETTFTINNDLYTTHEYKSEYNGEIITDNLQLIGSGKNGELHKVDATDGSQYLNFISNSEYMIIIFDVLKAERR